MKMPRTTIPNEQNDRKKRLADALRQNLSLRKDRARAYSAKVDRVESGDSSKSDAK